MVDHCGRAKRIQLRVADELLLRLSVIKIKPADGLVCIGIIGSLGMMAATAVMNHRFGYRLGGNDEVERLVFACGLAFADVVKMVMPFTFAVGLKKKDWLAATGSGAFFAVATISSFYAGIGLGSEHRVAN